MTYISGREKVRYKGKEYSVLRDHYNGTVDIAEVLDDNGYCTMLGEYFTAINRMDLNDAIPYTKDTV